MTPIIISPENHWPTEAKSLTALFEAGLAWYHLRKPQQTSKAVEALMQQIPATYHNRIVLHYHFDLAERFDWKGFHFNKKNYKQHLALNKHNKTYSYSAHSFAEVEEMAPLMDYQFISPIFNSISKQGYSAAFSTESLPTLVQNAACRLVALGGIAPEHATFLKRCNFWGAAFLGFIWQQELTVNERTLRFNMVQDAMQ